MDHFIHIFNRGLDARCAPCRPRPCVCLEAYAWPGNVRELQSAIRYALIHAAGEVLTPECLPENLRVWTASPAAGGSGAAPLAGFDLSAHVHQLLHSGETDIYRKACEAADRVILEAILRHTRGNQVQASELLGISRTTLRAKLSAGDNGGKAASAGVRRGGVTMPQAAERARTLSRKRPARAIDLAPQDDAAVEEIAERGEGTHAARVPPVIELVTREQVDVRIGGGLPVEAQVRGQKGNGVRAGDATLSGLGQTAALVVEEAK